MGDLLDALMQQLPADKRPKELRLLEIFNGKIYQVSALFSLEDPSYREQLRPERGLDSAALVRCDTHAQAAPACGEIARLLNTWLGGCFAVPGHRRALTYLFMTASNCSQALLSILLRC